MSRRVKNIEIENARIMFRNFEGKPDKYNRDGKRNFCVLLDDELAKELKKEGWNVKTLTPKYEEDDPIPYLQVAVSYLNRPPKVLLCTSKRNKQMLDEDTIGDLDYMDIENIDLIISPYEWEVNGKTGIKGYLKTMYVTPERDLFSSKYEDDLPFTEV